MPMASPEVANAEGSVSSPEPMTVLARLKVDAAIEAPALGEEMRLLRLSVKWPICLALRGDLLVSSSNDETAKLWSVRGRASTATLTEHTGVVISVDISDEVIATGSRDTTARIWPHDGGASRHTLPHPSNVNALHIDGDTLATGCIDRVVRTWSVASGQLTRELRGHDDWVTSVALYGGVLVSGSLDKTLRVWSVAEGEEGKCVATLEGHTRAVRGVALVPSGGGRIASLGVYELIMWEPVAGA